MAVRKIIDTVYQERIFIITKIQMSAMPGDEHRQPAGHTFCSRKIKPLAAARQNERIGNLVEKVHLLLVKFFGNNLDSRGVLSPAGQACHPAVNRIGRVVKGLDNQKYRITARESEAIGGDQLLDSLARQAGRD